MQGSGPWAIVADQVLSSAFYPLGIMGRDLFFVPATCWTKWAQIILFSKKKFNDHPIYYTVYEQDPKTPPSKPQPEITPCRLTLSKKGLLVAPNVMKVKQVHAFCQFYLTFFTVPSEKILPDSTPSAEHQCLTSNSGDILIHIHFFLSIFFCPFFSIHLMFHWYSQCYLFYWTCSK